MSGRTLLLGVLVLVLLLAGVGSYYASAHPDGLERVAEQTGFAGSAEDGAAADGPLAGYEVDGVSGPRLSGGLAGVVGVLVTLLLAGGLGYAVRGRRRASPPSEGV